MPKFKCCNSAQPAVIFLLLAVVLTHIGHRVTERHLSLLRDRTQGLFATLIPLERRSLEAWREDRAADLRFYLTGPEGRQALASPATARPWLEAMRQAHPEYLGVTVVDSRGGLVAASGDAPPPPAPLRVHALEGAHIHWNGISVVDGRAAWDVLLGAAGRAALVRIDPSGKGLISLREDLMTAPGGVDVVLARPEGAGAVVLDHDPARPGAARLFPLGPDATVRAALEAPPGVVVEGTDHLGRSVFAATGALAQSDWRLLFLRDAGGPVAEARRLMAASGLAGSAAVAAGFFLVSYMYRRKEEENAQTSSRPTRPASTRRCWTSSWGRETDGRPWKASTAVSRI